MADGTGGWIKLHRSITSWEWYKDANTARLFIHLLLTANREGRSCKGLYIDRGQRLASLKQLSNELGISVKSVRTALNHLKNTQEVACTRANGFNKGANLITIENYEFYQRGQTEKKGKGARTSASNGQALGTHRAQNKKYKKDKNEKNISSRDESRREREIFEIISYLNDRTSRHYVPGTTGTDKPIADCLDAGHTVSEMKQVIDTKASEWQDTDYSKYLTPRTLFSPEHFQDYLNQKPPKPKQATLEELRAERDHLYEHWKETGDAEDEAEYRKVRAKVKSIERSMAE